MAIINVITSIPIRTHRQVRALREAPLLFLHQARVIGSLFALILLITACSLVQQEIEEPSDSSNDQVHFADVTKEVGLDFQHGAFRWDVSGDAVAMMGGGLCWLDYNNDNWLDLYVVNSYAVEEAGQWDLEGGLPRSALFRNDKGDFTDVSDGSGTDLQMRGNGCVAADFNLDGWTDLYITTRQHAALEQGRWHLHSRRGGSRRRYLRLADRRRCWRY
jgi:hypothetical protein